MLIDSSTLQVAECRTERLQLERELDAAVARVCTSLHKGNLGSAESHVHQCRLNSTAD